MTEILVLCTANVCRSVMAGAFLARRLAAAGEAVRVSSAGLLRDGDPPPTEVVSVMADHGIDVSGHRSRVADSGTLVTSDLILAMSRDQVRQVAVITPSIWSRVFTLKEFVRRSEQVGIRPDGTPLAAWREQAHVGRDRMALLGDSPEDDIADPFGGPLEAYVSAAALIEVLVGRLVGLCWPPYSPAMLLSPPRAERDDSAESDQG